MAKPPKHMSRYQEEEGTCDGKGGGEAGKD